MKDHGKYTMDICNGTDLDRLHAVANMDNPGRGAGRTFTECHTVAGVMETTREQGVICLIPSYQRITDIMRKMVFKVFTDHEINFYKSVHGRRYIFTMPDKRQKQVMFTTLMDAQQDIRGRDWPVVEFSEYKKEEKAGYEVGEDGEG